MSTERGEIKPAYKPKWKREVAKSLGKGLLCEMVVYAPKKWKGVRWYSRERKVGGAQTPTVDNDGRVSEIGSGLGFLRLPLVRFWL